MLVYGGEVWKRPLELSKMASVAPMAPRVKREKMDSGDFFVLGSLSGSKLRNLGCGVSVDFLFDFDFGTEVLLIQEG